MLLVVNYHYVNSNAYPFDGIYPVRPEQLLMQIETLGRHFEFVSLQQILNAVEKYDLPRMACMLTFDDGLCEQYEIAWEILRTQRVPGAFFVNPGPIVEQSVSPVHQIQLVRAYTDPNILESKIEAKLARENGTWQDVLHQVSDEELRLQYPYDLPDTRRLKYLLNFVLPLSLRDRIIGHLFDEILGPQIEWSRQFYMQPDQWQELAANRSLGSHALHHLPLASLSGPLIREQIGKAKAILEESTGTTVQAISYPYGGRESVSKRVACIASQCGFKVGLTMERSFNQDLADPLLLGRVDTNDVPGGKSPRFSIEAGEIHLLGDMGLSRSADFWDGQS